MTDLIRAVLIMTLTGTALTLLLFALKPLLRDRLPKSAQYYLWLAVLAALLTPVSKLVVLPANNPISNAPLQSIVAQLPIPTAAAARPQAPLGNAGSADSAVTTAPSASSAETAQPKSTPLDLILVLVYAAGALITLLYYVVNYKIYIGLHRRRNRPARAEELSILAVLCRHRRRVPRLYRNPLAATPMLVGLLRPAILLPDRDYTEAQLRAVLCHELCHLRRKDVLIRWISVFAVAVHWFNPLVWLARREMDRACELACDEAVIRDLDAEGKQVYGDTLIAIAAGSKIPRAVMATTLCEEKRTLKERLGAIMKSKKHTKLAVLVSAALALIVVLAACALGAGSAAQSPTAPGAAADTYGGTWYPSGDLYQKQTETIIQDAENLFAIDTDGAVLVSYDGGKTAVKSPVTAAAPDANAYYISAPMAGNVTLMDNSSGAIFGLAAYVSKSLTAVCYGSAMTEIKMAVSADAGQTWKTSAVPAPVPAQEGYVPSASAYPLKVRFMDSQRGWLVLSSGYAMGSQEPFLYTTADGGATWTESAVDGNWGAGGGITCVGFSTKEIGFVGYGVFNDLGPVVFATYDGGKSWNALTFSLPEEYSADYKYADSPVFDGADGIMPVHVRADPNGGYTVTINLLTPDYGATWTVGDIVTQPSEPAWTATPSDMAEPKYTALNYDGLVAPPGWAPPVGYNVVDDAAFTMEVYNALDYENRVVCDDTSTALENITLTFTGPETLVLRIDANDLGWQLQQTLPYHQWETLETFNLPKGTYLKIAGLFADYTAKHFASTASTANSDYNYSVPLPDDYTGKVMFGEGGADGNPITSVYDMAVAQAGVLSGWLFSISRYSPADYETFIRSLDGGAAPFAKDANYIYVLSMPTDVQGDTNEYRAFQSEIPQIEASFREANGLEGYLTGAWNISYAKDSATGADISLQTLYGSGIGNGGTLTLNADGTFSKYIGVTDGDKNTHEGTYTLSGAGNDIAFTFYSGQTAQGFYLPQDGVLLFRNGASGANEYFNRAN